jgi:2,3-dihydroxybenzoate-AMP ligase
MFQMGNVAETVVAYYGSVKAGLVPVCTLPVHREREIGLLARHTDARAHFVQGDFRSYDLASFAVRLRQAEPGLEVLMVARGAAPNGALGFAEILEAGRRPAARAALRQLRIDTRSVVVFQLSGGTTGLPKVAPRWHEEYVYNARRWAETWHGDRAPS